MNYRKKIEKKNKILILVLFLLVVTVGYATLNTTLSINGTSKINNSTWDIHFENYNPTNNSTVLPAEGKAPDTSGNNKTTISYEVEFNEPGDIYEFNIDAVNGGSIDGEIEKIVSTLKIGDNDAFTIADDYSNLPEYMIYSVTYSDNEPVTESHVLASEDSVTITVHVEFKRDITNAQFNLAKGTTLRFNQELDTIQKTSNINNTVPINSLSGLELVYPGVEVFGVGENNENVTNTLNISTTSGTSDIVKYVCTNYNADKRDGKAMCFAAGDYENTRRLLIDIFGEDCDTYYDYGIWCNKYITEDEEIIKYYFCEAYATDTGNAFYDEYVEEYNGLVYCSYSDYNTSKKKYCGVTRNNILECGENDEY